MKKQSFLVIIMIIFCLSASIGYALFSERININGTANARGNFDVIFENAMVKTEIGSTGATAVISEDKNILTLTVPRLEYPGAYVEFNVDVTNAGNIPAVLKNITETGLTSNTEVKISYSGLAVNEVMAQSDKRTITIKVEWLSQSVTGVQDVEFSIKLNYEQITV